MQIKMSRGVSLKCEIKEVKTRRRVLEIRENGAAARNLPQGLSRIVGEIQYKLGLIPSVK
jgi:hypothetical protein